jgi:hypothetical protein
MYSGEFGGPKHTHEALTLGGLGVRVDIESVVAGWIDHLIISSTSDHEGPRKETYLREPTIVLDKLHHTRERCLCLCPHIIGDQPGGDDLESMESGKNQGGTSRL